ncbi:MAG: SDR family NAD(P)-dependent oxidoreductase [Ferruginibacter sp.]
MKKTVFITGATAGIGKACAEKFAANNYRLIITARREALLEEVRQELVKKYNADIITLCFDVQDKEAVFKAVGSLEDRDVHILINNAGLALGRDPFDQADLTEWDTMIHTNVNGLLYVSRALMPAIKRVKGHIVNIGSTAGREVYENGNVYCASKFAVDAITKSMRLDLLKYGIKVTAVNPGGVETEFSLVRYRGDEVKAKNTYTGWEPLTPADVAEAIFYCGSLPAHVCINDLTITSLDQANSFTFLKKS